MLKSASNGPPSSCREFSSSRLSSPSRVGSGLACGGNIAPRRAWAVLPTSPSKCASATAHHGSRIRPPPAIRLAYAQTAGIGVLLEIFWQKRLQLTLLALSRIFLHFAIDRLYSKWSLSHCLCRR